ncbi:hypothetical protein TREPR_2902 [Treponema primitia ZAS-2]|uniref:Uncharacterized protein n=1 Tax=Treponema primitia (strain ATCC BAA-887 / DSM 12427 / ZAS-2) TaxID=545694 RepID=F5YP92_TREPZ|nr:hypothetical protein [Treponema primitia]AEF83937.1 hypothetical protein TREPR_2902 [Treponema primitia ZAS-2]
MAEMTEEEADALDTYFTENTIMPDLNKPGYFARKYGMMVKLDPKTTGSVVAWAESAHKTPAQIIGELVQERLASKAAG